MPPPSSPRRPSAGALGTSAAALTVVALLVLPSSTSSQDLPGELRVFGAGVALRRSSDVPDSSPYTSSHHTERSVHLDSGLGIRLYPGGEHGLFVEAAYLADMDWDALVSDDVTSEVHYAVARAGYAYRTVSEAPRRPGRWAMATTVRVGLATGFAWDQSVGADLPKLAPLVGVAVAVDWDFHFGRFFCGWGFSYDVLVHARGAMRVSQLFSFGLVPALRLGVTFGPRIQDPRTSDRERDLARSDASRRAAGAF